MTRESDRTLEHDLAVDEACGRFEADWKAGRRPRVEDYVADADAAIRQTLRAELTEIAAELTGGAKPESRTLGDYELLRKVGAGGMGAVYEARHRTLGRTVALKVLLSGDFADAEEVARFRREAESAARLDHPGMVPVYEFAADAGRHFLTMAFVPGGSLAERLRDGPLPPREAAELARRVAEATAYAHGRGVVHRDLKPGNILLDADGRPRVTDFGLAKKSCDFDLTRSGAILGTPGYMAPEQAGMKSAAVGPASDVFALGAVLYACLTGRPPFHGVTLADTLDQVRHHDPAAPRSVQPGVPRDLEAVCLKCLEKKPASRYASADELAFDLDRFLRGESVRARRVGPLGRAWRWAGRNPAVATLGTGLAAVLVAGLAVSLAQWLRAEGKAAEAIEQRNLARAEAAKAWAATEFLLADMIRASSPGSRGHRLRVVEVMDAAVGRIAARFAGQPAAEALVRHVIGQTYGLLGRPKDAEPQLREAVAIRRKLHPGGHRDLADSLAKLAAAVGNLGNHEEAVALLREARGMAAGVLTSGDPLARWIELSLGEELQTLGRRDEAEAILLEAVRGEPGGDFQTRLQFAHALASLAAIAEGREDWAEAERLRRRGLHLAERLGDQVLTAAALANLGNLLAGRGRNEEAEPLLRRAVSLAEKALPPGDWRAGLALVSHGRCLAQLGRVEEAEPLMLKGYRKYRAAAGVNHMTEQMLKLMVRLRRLAGREGEALPLWQELVACRMANAGPGEERSVILSANQLTLWMRRKGRLKEHSQYCLGLSRRGTEGMPAGEQRARFLCNWGLVLHHWQDYARAIPLLEASYREFEGLLGPEDGQTRWALGRLVKCCEEAGDAERVEKYRPLSRANE